MLCAPFLASAGQDRFDDFELPAAKAGDSVDKVLGWRLPADDEGTKSVATITSAEAAGGMQSVEIKAESVLETSLAGGIRFVDFRMLPLYAEGDTGTVINISGAWLGFASEGPVGTVGVFPGTSETFSAVGECPIKEGRGNEWLRVTVRLDTAAGKWDLFLDGEPVRANIPLGEERGVFEIAAPVLGSVFLDEFSESSVNPLFPDKDADGIPDAEEKVYGMRADINDRDGDLDLDGVSNVEEVFSGTTPRDPVAGEGAYIYVDNLAGSDSNSGKTSRVSSEVEGPKASIKAAIEAAQDGDTIVVMKGSGIYFEESQLSEKKQVRIRPVASIKIRKSRDSTTE